MVSVLEEFTSPMGMTCKDRRARAGCSDRGKWEDGGPHNVDRYVGGCPRRPRDGLRRAEEGGDGEEGYVWGARGISFVKTQDVTP